MWLFFFFNSFLSCSQRKGSSFGAPFPDASGAEGRPAKTVVGGPAGGEVGWTLKARGGLWAGPSVGGAGGPEMALRRDANWEGVPDAASGLPEGRGLGLHAKTPYSRRSAAAASRDDGGPPAAARLAPGPCRWPRSTPSAPQRRLRAGPVPAAQHRAHYALPGQPAQVSPACRFPLPTASPGSVPTSLQSRLFY